MQNKQNININRFAALGCEATITALYLILAFLGDLREHIPYMIGVTGAITSLLACRITLAASGIPISPWRVVIFASVFRLLFVFQPPYLSDDIFRYLLDGLTLLQGINPYQFSPLEMANGFQGLAPLIQKVNHPHLNTIYPPAAELLFTVGAAIGKGVIGIKALLSSLDILLCLLIMRALKTWGYEDLSSTILYAWNPLPVLEIASSGHIDGAGVLVLLMAALILLKPNLNGIKAWAGGAALAISFGIKLIPAIYTPLLFSYPSKTRERMVATVSLLLTVAFFFLLFSSHIDKWLKTLKIYLLNWEFSSLSFRILRECLSPQRARMLLLSIFIFGAFRLLIRNKRERASIIDGCYKLTFLFLLTTPTLHPWYVIYLCALLPMATRPSGLIFSWTCLLSYKVQIAYSLLGVWKEDTVTAAMVALPPLLTYCLESCVRATKAASAAGESTTPEPSGPPNPLRARARYPE